MRGSPRALDSAAMLLGKSADNSSRSAEIVESIGFMECSSAEHPTYPGSSVSIGSRDHKLTIITGDRLLTSVVGNKIPLVYLGHKVSTKFRCSSLPPELCTISDQGNTMSDSTKLPSCPLRKHERGVLPEQVLHQGLDKCSKN